MLPRSTQQIVDEYVVMKRALIQIRAFIDSFDMLGDEEAKDMWEVTLGAVDTVVNETLIELNVPSIEDIMGIPNEEKK